jgi:hypothetical protein
MTFSWGGELYGVVTSAIEQSHTVDLVRSGGPLLLSVPRRRTHNDGRTDSQQVEPTKRRGCLFAREPRASVSPSASAVGANYRTRARDWAERRSIATCGSVRPCDWPASGLRLLAARPRGSCSLEPKRDARCHSSGLRTWRGTTLLQPGEGRSGFDCARSLDSSGVGRAALDDDSANSRGRADCPVNT